jgi:hypothetical protein
LALAVALLTAIALTPAAHAVRAAKARVATTVTITNLTVNSTATDATLTVTGRVKLPVNTAGERRRVEVYLTLVGDSGETVKTESFTAKLTSKDRFTATYITKLTGALGLDADVKIAGKQAGKKAVRTISVTLRQGTGTVSTDRGSAGSTTPGATTPGSPASPGSPSSPGSPGTPTPTGTPLIGTFEFESGAEHPDGLISGTYFRMRGIINNTNSPFLDQEYTPLSPGSDGGLETFAYQEPPTPAFGPGDLGPETGNPLADEIVQPKGFLGGNFSIVNAPTDLQEDLADPLPTIIDTNGKLSGQITAWDAQWKGLSFNQGAPKANGTLPGSTALPAGAYDTATGHYVLTWTSEIIGGPFNGQTGEWHLEGTFVPQA